MTRQQEIVIKANRLLADFERSNNDINTKINKKGKAAKDLIKHNVKLWEHK